MTEGGDSFIFKGNNPLLLLKKCVTILLKANQFKVINAIDIYRTIEGSVIWGERRSARGNGYLPFGVLHVPKIIDIINTFCFFEFD